MMYLEAFTSAFRFRPILPILDIKLALNLEFMKNELRKTNDGLERWRDEYQSCITRGTPSHECTTKFNTDVETHWRYLNRRFPEKIFEYTQFYVRKVQLEKLN